MSAEGSARSSVGWKIVQSAKPQSKERRQGSPEPTDVKEDCSCVKCSTSLTYVSYTFNLYSLKYWHAVISTKRNNNRWLNTIISIGGGGCCNLHSAWWCLLFLQLPLNMGAGRLNKLLVATLCFSKLAGAEKQHKTAIYFPYSSFSCKSFLQNSSESAWAWSYRQN